MTVSLELLSRGPARPDLTEDLVVAETELTAVLARWSVKAPVAVPAGPEIPDGPDDTGGPDGSPDPDDVAAVLADDVPALVDVVAGLAGPGPEQDRLVDLLVVAVHSGVGFGSGLVPRVTDAAQVWALLAGAVAAMTGADARAALEAPDPDALLALGRSAREAVRDVVTCVAVPATLVDRVVADLTDRTRVGGAG